MQLTDIFCYLVFTITISTQYVPAKSEQSELSETNSEKRISKREAAIFIDNFPIEPMYKHRPKVIYRRISKQRYKSPKPKYGPPNKYRSSKPWKPSKKYRRTVKPKYGPPSYKRLPTKPKYGPPKPKKYKPVYGVPKKMQFSSFYPSEPVGFGEPPSNTDFQLTSYNFGEPPVESYGGSLKDSYAPEQFSPTSSFGDAFVNFEDLNPNFGQDYNKPWQNFQSDQSLDSNVAYSKIRPAYIKPEPSFDVQDEDFNINPYSHIYKHREFYTDQKPLPFEKNKFSDYGNNKAKAKPWKPQKIVQEPEDEVLVGGHYAEPPERYVPKLSIDQYSDDDDFTPVKGYIDPDVAISATISPYVNYKNSNMAFSPQNLNDAFSIVDK